MTRRIAAILMCAVMVLVAAAPLALATHEVVKYGQGPRASAVTWEYVPAALGLWSGHIVNNGLRSLAVNVYDNTSGVPDQISHQAIRFAAYDANPVGTVDTKEVIMAAGHVYDITVIPNGPKGATCTVDDVYRIPQTPVAVISLVSQEYLTVSLSGALSQDDGPIVSYAWDFGDGWTATEMDVVHAYAMAAEYRVTLTVTDTDGLTDSAEMLVTVTEPPLPDQPPVARFAVTANGLTVNVDAAASSDDNGIVSYVWTWGDGTTDSGMTATHTYAPAVTVSASALSGRAPPGTPHAVFGYTYDSDGVTVLTGCDVTITDLSTGESITTTSDPVEGIYSIDLSALQNGWAFGDILRVTATKGTGMVGSAEAPVTDTPLGYDQIDVILQPTGGSMNVIITLTVTDTIGQTNSVSQQVTLVW